jgi:hypothetical protein
VSCTQKAKERIFTPSLVVFVRVFVTCCTAQQNYKSAEIECVLSKSRFRLVFAHFFVGEKIEITRKVEFALACIGITRS